MKTLEAEARASKFIPIKKVSVAIDLSKHSEATATYAAELARCSSASLTLVNPDDKQQKSSVERLLGGVRHILIPINLAQDSPRTISCAIRLGQRFGSRLTLLHVYQPPVAFGLTSGTYRNMELLKDRHEAEEMLKTQGSLVRAAYPNCEWVMRSGDAGEGILEVTLELRVDLIVTSSRHPHWYDRYRPTNIADYILRHAACPILEVSDSGESLLNCLDNRAGRAEPK